jgi:trypsin
MFQHFSLILLPVLILTVQARPNSKIVGGDNAQAGDAPFQVGLFHTLSGDIFCSGAILDANTVLTAASCCDSLSPSDVELAYGSLKQGQGYVRLTRSKLSTIT